MGATKVVYYLYKKPESDFVALVIASPPDMLGLVRVEAEGENFERDFAEAKKLVAEGSGKTFLSNIIWSWYYISAETYLNLMADGAETDVFPILRGGDFNELESIKIPILAFMVVLMTQLCSRQKKIWDYQETSQKQEVKNLIDWHSTA